MSAEDRVRALVDEHYDFVWRTLRYLGLTDADAEDAAQQVMCVLARRIADVERPRQPDPGGKRGFEEIQCLGNGGLHVHGRAVPEPDAAESEDALDQQLRALRGMQHVVEVAPQIGVSRGVLGGELAVPQDGAEDVVEVVGDAAGERADRLHFLRLAQLRLEPFLLNLRLLACGDVDRGTDESRGPPLDVSPLGWRTRYSHSKFAVRPSK